MISTARTVTFDCGHAARRLCKSGRSLLGQRLRCSEHSHADGPIDREVIAETDPYDLRRFVETIS